MYYLCYMHWSLDDKNIVWQSDAVLEKRQFNKKGPSPKQYKCTSRRPCTNDWADRNIYGKKILYLSHSCQLATYIGFKCSTIGAFTLILFLILDLVSVTTKLNLTNNIAILLILLLFVERKSKLVFKALLSYAIQFLLTIVSLFA